MVNLKRVILDSLPTSWTGRLRLLRLKWMINRYHSRVVEHQYGAGSLKVYLSDPLAEGWYDCNWPELPEVTALRWKLRAGATVFDFGAHQGVVAMMLAREVGPSGRVIAVEPNSHNTKAIEKNRELNCMPQLQTVRAAVSDKPGSLTFNKGLNGQIDDGTGSWGKVTVEAVTIDQLAEQYGMPDVVFLDVEGAEGCALVGATQVLASGAAFLVEVHVGRGLEKLGGSVTQIFEHFPPDHYSLLARAEGDASFRPIPDRERDVLASDHFFLLANPRS